MKLQSYCTFCLEKAFHKKEMKNNFEIFMIPLEKKVVICWFKWRRKELGYYNGMKAIFTEFCYCLEHSRKVLRVSHKSMQNYHC